MRLERLPSEGQRKGSFGGWPPRIGIQHIRGGGQLDAASSGAIVRQIEPHHMMARIVRLNEFGTRLDETGRPSERVVVNRPPWGGNVERLQAHRLTSP